MCEFKIRYAKRADIPAIVEMANALNEFVGNSPSSFLRRAPAFLMKILFGNAAQSFCLLVEADKKIIGYAICYWGINMTYTAPILHLEDLYVMESYRRHGVGEALMAQLAKICKAKRAKYLSWLVRKSNKTAQAFYKKIKAKEVLADMNLKAMYLDT